MKNAKRYFFVLFYLVLFVFMFISCGSDPERDNPDVIRLGKTADIRNDTGKIIASITFDDVTFEEREDSGNITAIFDLTIRTYENLIIVKENFLLTVGYETYASEDDMIKTSVEENLVLNGFDIFLTELSPTTTVYRFSYTFPVEKNEQKYFECAVVLQVFHTYKFYEPQNQTNVE